MDKQLEHAHAVVNELDKVKQQELGEHKKELEEFHVTDGKSRDKEEIKKIQELEELVGIAQSNPFETLDRDVFASKLNDMTRTDLQNMCIKAGVMPRDSSLGMQQALAKEFDRFCQRHGATMPSQPQLTIDPSSPHYKEVVKLLEI